MRLQPRLARDYQPLDERDGGGDHAERAADHGDETERRPRELEPFRNRLGVAQLEVDAGLVLLELWWLRVVTCGYVW